MRLLSVAGWKRLFVTGLCLVAWRALEQVAVPGLNPALIAQLEGLASSLPQAFGSSTALASNSVVALGIGPYVTAIIIVNLARVASKQIRTLEETAEGRQRLLVWTRGVAVVLALGQAYGYTMLMQNTFPPGFSGLDWSARLFIMLPMAGGTVILIFLADVLDQFGLGFGNGAFLIYVLTPVAIEANRLAIFLPTLPSQRWLYLPFAVWIAFSVIAVAASVGAVLAVRRFPAAGEEDTSEWKPVELRLFMSGVLRPPVLASAVLFLPTLVLNFYAPLSPGLVSRLTNELLTSYGNNLWTDVAYAAVDACLVVAFAFLVVKADTAYRPVRPDLIPHVNRLIFIGGVLLAFITVVLPFLEWNASRLAGQVFGLSGLDAALISVIVLSVVVGLERSARRETGTPIVTSPVP
jgi:preprotein translocase subunit SecY